MDTINLMSPKDTTVLQDLLKQEKLGETGFAAFYQGNQQAGIQQMKQALYSSNVDVQLINDYSIHGQTTNLLTALNKAISQYMKNPSDENLSALKSDAADYKGFLSQFPQ